MKVLSFILTTGLALAFVVPASAQSNDTAYCQVLTGKYQEYVARGSGRHEGVDTNAEARMAIDKCRAGDVSGIPVLEHALKNAGMDLPTRG
jgi:hypothetical protein